MTHGLPDWKLFRTCGPDMRNLSLSPRTGTINCDGYAALGFVQTTHEGMLQVNL